ncbi:hypothetical protein TUM3794_20640 [Shewanella colwelliana]|uniref:DUF4400 domain-containing protein n=1 Tax=Shewanella colwelliana TaxID=23 RepID=A0ABQ4P0N5_SHECO|nr:DUF4400 domain-containing protein [Shewanella colwelliana]GIU41068.1 hypothetical protein TUM3794_20640 [Shewanella colwelliana]
MAELVKEHGATKLFGVLLLIFTISLIVVLALVPSNKFQQQMETEVKALSLLLNDTRWGEVTNNVSLNYYKYYENSGLREKVDLTLTPKGDYKLKQIVKNYKGESVLQRAATNIHIMSYQIIYRVTVIQYWIWLMLPLLFAMIYEGYTARKIRLYEPEQISIKGSRLWTRSIVYLILISFTYLVLPNLLGQYAPWYPVATLFLTGYAIRNTVKNYMKVA